MLDAAYWVKGCSSLGRLRIAVITGVGEPPFSNESLCLLDVKEAVAAAAPNSSESRMPRSNAVRVVTGARQVVPSLGDRMRAGQLMGKEVFIRELLPQDLKIEIDQLTCDEAIKLARCLSEVVGKAHARQMDATCQRWRRELARGRSKSLDAPRGSGGALLISSASMRRPISTTAERIGNKH
jgi:uncharacterized protein (DUF2252 family)